MNKLTLAIRLTGTKIRVNTLISRLEEICDNGRIKDYNGYIPGYIPDDPGKTSILTELEDNVGNEKTPIESLLEFVAENYTESDNAWNILYHLNNVKGVISKYFKAICRGRFNPSKEVLDCDIAGCKMVVETIDDIISKLKVTK